MKNYFQLDLGEDTEGRPIKRGIKLNNRTLQILQDTYGADPVSMFSGEDISSHLGLIKASAKLVYAGLLTICATKKQEPDFTEEQVNEWVQDMSFDESYGIVAAFMKMLNPDSLTDQVKSTSPEVVKEANTQQPEANVAVD